MLFRLQNDFTVFADMPSLLAIALQPFPAALNLIISDFWLSVIALFSFRQKTASIVKAALFGLVNISDEPLKARLRSLNDCCFLFFCIPMPTYGQFF